MALFYNPDEDNRPPAQTRAMADHASPSDLPTATPQKTHNMGNGGGHFGWLGGDEEPEQNHSTIKRKFWVQENINNKWVNNGEFTDDKQALTHLVQLLKQAEDISLRMVMSDYSLINGQHDFKPVILVRASTRGPLQFTTQFAQTDAGWTPYLSEHIKNIAPELQLNGDNEVPEETPPLSNIMGDDVLTLKADEIRDMLYSELKPHLDNIKLLVKAELDRYFAATQNETPQNGIGQNETPQNIINDQQPVVGNVAPMEFAPANDTPAPPAIIAEQPKTAAQRVYQPSYFIADSAQITLPQVQNTPQNQPRGEFANKAPDLPPEPTQITDNPVMQQPANANISTPTPPNDEFIIEPTSENAEYFETEQPKNNANILNLDSVDASKSLHIPGRKTALKMVNNRNMGQTPLDNTNPFQLFKPKNNENANGENDEENMVDDTHSDPLAMPRDNRAHANRTTGRHASVPARQINNSHKPRRSKKLASGLMVGFLAVAAAFGVADKSMVQNISLRVSDGIKSFLPEPDLVDAIRRVNPVMVRQLLEKGANPNVKDRYGDPVILTAARLSDMASLNLLAQAGAKFTEKDKFGQPVIHTLAMEGRVDALEAILKLGAPVDYRIGQSCRTPLQIATENGRTRVVQLLTENGAEINKLPGCEKSPQEYALNTEIMDIFQKVSAERREKAQKQEQAQQTASLPAPTTKDDIQKPLSQFESKIIAAIKTNDIKIVANTIKQLPDGVKLTDLNIFVSGVSGTAYRNLTDYALVQKSYNVAAFLQRKAGINYSPEMLHWAIDEGDKPESKDLAKFLLKLGGDVNSIHAGLTPLMRAAVRNRLELVDALLKAGADPQIKSNKGETASNLASLTGNKELMETLIMAEKEDDYHEVMGQLSWGMTLADAEKQSEVCSDIQDNFRACKINKREWLGEKNVVLIALFDKLNNNKLVAIQVDLSQTRDPDQLKKNFERVVYKISQSVPKNHHNFTDRQEKPGVPLFEGLLPKNKTHDIYSYWSDEDRQKPVFIHVKLQADKADTGSIRVKIGNPFRAG